MQSRLSTLRCDPAVIKSSFENEVIVLPTSLVPNEEWYYKVGEWLDKWGYTKSPSKDYLPDYLSVYKDVLSEAGIK